MYSGRVPDRSLSGPEPGVRSLDLHGGIAARGRGRPGPSRSDVQQVGLEAGLTQCRHPPGRPLPHRRMGLRILDGGIHPGRSGDRPLQPPAPGPVGPPVAGAGREALGPSISGPERGAHGLDAGRSLCYDTDSFFECAGGGPGAFRTHPFSNVGGLVQILTRTVHA